TSRWSRPISPNSLMMTAVSASSGRRSSLFSRVVLPLPRKPVSTVTGMRSSAAVWVCVPVCVPVWVSVIFTPSVSPSPEAPDLPERLPCPLQTAVPVLFARRRLLGELGQRPGDVFRRPGRDGDVGHHLAGHRAIVQGAERALEAHCRLDIGPRRPGIKRPPGEGRHQERRGIAQLLDG